MADIGCLKLDTSKGKILARLSIRANESFLQTAADMVTDMARTCGLKEKSINRLNKIVLEVIRNVIKFGYAGDSDQFIDVVIEKRSHSLVVAIEDQGLPFDYQVLESGEDSRFSQILSRGYADAVHFISLGKNGNRVELVRNFPVKDIRDEADTQPIQDGQEQETAPEDEPLAIRIMSPEESRQLSQVVYRCYDYSYACEFVYFPEKVASRIRSGLMISCAAFNPADEIVGHLALSFHRRDASVAESGQAVVDPRYRGHGIFKTLKQFLRDFAEQRKMAGIYSEAVTVHPYSQKGNLALGAHEVGFLLGYSPGKVSFRSIKEEENPRRQSIAFMYLPVQDSNSRQVFPPMEYGLMLERIYQNAGLNRKISPPAIHPEKLPASGSFHLSLRTDHNQAVFTILQIGRDTPKLINTRRRRLNKAGIICTYVDLPLEQKGNAWLGSQLRGQGFFFGTLIPEYEAGDVLRLQHLNNVEIRSDDIHTASDFGKQLLDFIFLEYKTAEDNIKS